MANAKAAALALLLLSASSLTAQEEGQRRPFVLGLGAGPSTASMSVGDESASEGGLSYTARVGKYLGTRSVLGLELDVQPYDVTNPARAEAFRSTYILFSAQFYLGRGSGLYVRPAAGVQSRRWSGPDPVTDADIGVALGVAGGYEFLRSRRISVAPELYWRSALIEIEGGVSAMLAGLRIVALWKP